MMQLPNQEYIMARKTRIESVSFHHILNRGVEK